MDSRLEDAGRPGQSIEIGVVADGFVDELCAIAWRGAAAILKVDPAAAERRLKSDHSPVCRADLRAEAAIADGLSRLWPGLPIVSEEAVACPRPAMLPDTFALIDPLDGTREFLAGRPEFTVNIAIIVKGAPVLGVIAAPAQRTIWRGVVGRGAERVEVPRSSGNEYRASDTIRIATRPWPTAGITVAVSRSHFDEATAGFLSRFLISERMDCGSSLKFCRIAEGSADLYPRLAPICEWDIAAGHAIAAAAGGAVVAHDGTPLVYGSGPDSFRLGGCIAVGDPSAVPRIGEAQRPG